MLHLEDQLKFIYLELIIRQGKPTGFFTFKTKVNSAKTPVEIVILYWLANEKRPETTFCTLGMSSCPMRDHSKGEVCLSVRDDLDEDQIMAFCRFLANFSVFPFLHNFAFNWWNIITDIGPVPVYSNATTLLILPNDSGTQANEIQMGDEKITLFNIRKVIANDFIKRFLFAFS